MCSSVTAATFARAHRRSMNPEPAPSTSSLACHHRFPTADLLHHRETPMVSPSTACAPNRDPHLQGTSFPGHSPPVGRIRPASHAPVGNGGSSPVSVERAERPKWAKPLSPAGPSATASVAHCNNAIFLLSFELFKIQFKFSLNF
jgi:hypothetical protein